MLNLSCVICAELFAPNDDVYVTVCGHMFHFTCLKQWLERSKSCPQCRNKCNDRNIYRVYFNLANLDVSRIDVGSLQEQLDNANLQIKMKEKSANAAAEQIKILKDGQRKCMKTISGLEQKLLRDESLIRAYKEQLELLKADAKIVDDLRKEVKSLKAQIDTMEGVSSILTASKADADKLLKNESNPQKLAAWVATLKRELRACESKKTDFRNLIKVLGNDIRKAGEVKRTLDDRISQLESENYRLTEKLKAYETKNAATSNLQSSAPHTNIKPISPGQQHVNLLTQVMREERRATISPTIKDNIKKIEESSSPYLNIKSSSIGLVPLFKRHHEARPGGCLEASAKNTTTKLATLKISPKKVGSPAASGSGAVLKTTSDMSEKYSIFKKPRLGMVSAAISAGTASLMKPLGPNFVFNGFGGTEKVDPFERNVFDDNNSDCYEVQVDYSDRTRKSTTSKGAPSDKPSNTSTVPKASVPSLNSRLKAGSLRDYKTSKKA